MPFDAAAFGKSKTTRKPRRMRPETIRTRARRAAYALAFVIDRYESHEWLWVQGDNNPGYPQRGICAGYALRMVKRGLMIRENWINAYVTRAIEQEAPWARPLSTDALGTIIHYNDSPGRTFDEVMNVLRLAQRFAEAEAEAG